MEWIKCSKQLPEYEGKYLVAILFNDGAKAMDLVDFYPDDFMWGESQYAMYNNKPYKITHWQYLPEYPEIEKVGRLEIPFPDNCRDCPCWRSDGDENGEYCCITLDPISNADWMVAETCPLVLVTGV